MTGLDSGSRTRSRMPGGGLRPGLATTVKIAVAVLAGLVVFLLRVPFSGDDSQPPTCYSIFKGRSRFRPTSVVDAMPSASHFCPVWH